MENVGKASVALQFALQAQPLLFSEERGFKMNWLGFRPALRGKMVLYSWIASNLYSIKEVYYSHSKLNPKLNNTWVTQLLSFASLLLAPQSSALGVGAVHLHLHQVWCSHWYSIFDPFRPVDSFEWCYPPPVPDVLSKFVPIIILCSCDTFKTWIRWWSGVEITPYMNEMGEDRPQTLFYFVPQKNFTVK